MRRRCSAPWSRRAAGCPAAASTGAAYEGCPSAIGTATTGGRRSSARVDPHDPGTDFWRSTPNGLAELLHRLGMPASVAGYGNVLACVASLWGPSVEELSAEKLDVAHPRFLLVACAHAEKAR